MTQAQKRKANLAPPKIAIFDIETGPSLGYYWGKPWETNIVGVKSPWSMLCFSYKWFGEHKIYTHSLREYPHYQKDLLNDHRLIKDLWQVFNEAEILIAHNGDRFDIRKTNAKFIEHGMKPPRDYKTIDTLKIARRYFQFDSNKLNDLAQFLKIGKKLPTTGFDLWRRCMGGDEAAWNIMERYNRRDIRLLEDVYLKLRPYAASHPNLELYTESGCCPVCQSASLQGNGIRVTIGRKYRRYRCTNCGHNFKGEHIPREIAQWTT